MTTNAIPAPIMYATAVAVAGARDWQRDQAEQGLDTGELAFAADVVDRLNGEGYVVARAEAIQALWHENEHLKQRLADFKVGPCGCGEVSVGGGHAVAHLTDDAHDNVVHRVGAPCHFAGDY